MENEYKFNQKANFYKNFRRNMLGECIDFSFYERNDQLDDKNSIHMAFDIGFLSALEKLKYEQSLLSYQASIDKEVTTEVLAHQFTELINAYIAASKVKVEKIARANELEKIFKRNSLRISDDF